MLAMSWFWKHMHGNLACLEEMRSKIKLLAKSKKHTVNFKT